MGETTKQNAFKYSYGNVSVHVEATRYRVRVGFSGMMISNEVMQAVFNSFPGYISWQGYYDEDSLQHVVKMLYGERIPFCVRKVQAQELFKRIKEINIQQFCSRVYLYDEMDTLYDVQAALDERKNKEMVDIDKRALSREEAAYRKGRIEKMESAQQALFKENKRIEQRDNAVIAAMKF